MDDYTNKYKGEQVELALFGGEYQEGVLTAYCSIDDVPARRVEQPHPRAAAERRLSPLLDPLRRAARRRLAAARSSRRRSRRQPRRELATGVRLAAAGNVLKTWLIVGILSGAAGGIGWLLAGRRGATLFVFCSLLAALGSTRTAIERCSACSAPARMRWPRIPCSGRPSTASRRRSGRQPAEDLPARRPLPACVRGRARAAKLNGRRQHGPARRPPARRARELLAHELAHVRSRDVLTQTFAVLLAVMLVEASRSGGWFSRGLLYVLGPLGAAFVHLTLSPKRELGADRLPRRRPALRWRSPTPCSVSTARANSSSFAASPATSPLYAIDPFDDSRLSRMFRTHPPLETRLLKLRAMGG